jgi:cation-dependent mannose-6-phosphate receptor
MRFSWTTAALMAIGVAGAAKDDDSTSTSSAPACIATSVSSGAYFDLRPDIARHDGESKSKYGVTKDYHARGYDYGKNFTLNICGPVLEPVKDVAGVDKSEWANVSAYYTYHDKVYSIGLV